MVVISSPNSYVMEIAYRLRVKGRRNVILAQTSLLLIITDEGIRLG